jgi:carbonic anhydrase
MDKKDGKLRMCIDYRALNKITIKNNYHLFHIDNLLDRFNGTKYFNQIDFKLGYYHIHIMDEDAMRTKYGSYEFLVMQFGLCNVLSTFTTFMNFMWFNSI